MGAAPGSSAKVAGTLCVVAGMCTMLGSFILAGIGVAAFTALGSVPGRAAHGLPLIPLVVFIPLSVLLFALAAVAIAGGVAGIRRRHFWLLLVGAAAAVVCFLPLGVVALVFAVLAEKEFD